MKETKSNETKDQIVKTIFACLSHLFLIYATLSLREQLPRALKLIIM